MGRKKLLQINSVINTGSTGRIAEGIGLQAMKQGWESYIAYGRYGNHSKSKLIKIGSKRDNYVHVLKTRLFDRHGLGSTKATKVFIEEIKRINPDIVHLHNIHGYYLNYKTLFGFLSVLNITVVWTFHDCWPFTGHCAYFDLTDCEKWKINCKNCPCSQTYPKSWFTNNSHKNFIDKKKAFTGHSNITIVTPSHWLKNLINQSFLKNYKVKVIHNGVDLDVFRPVDKYCLNVEVEIILGVASVWEKRKGLNDFIELSKILSDRYKIVLIGVSKEQRKQLPSNIEGISRTENVEELVTWYNRASVFVNPTYEDNFPTTNIEAIACGTPVVTYETGGSPEAIDEETGWIVPQGDIYAIRKILDILAKRDREKLRENCRKRAELLFDKKERFAEYILLYEKLIALKQ